MTDNITHHDRIAHVQDYIVDNLDQPLQREVLADLSGYSIPHFHRVFTACVGESAASYVRRMRMIGAGSKLRFGAVDITQVALAAGYESHATFSKAFKKFYSMTPREFRSLTCQQCTQILRQRRHP